MPPRRRRSRWVTLTTDIGWAYAAQMKAVLAHSLRPGELVDLAHDLAPHRVAEAGFLLRAMAERFPAGSVHIAVVDPGVGGARAPLAIRCRDGSVLIGPDNGVLAPLAHRLGRPIAYRLDPRRVRGAPRVGRTFDGRDLFAPAAARVVEGIPVRHLGPRTRFRDVPPPDPERMGGELRGEVVHTDRFGNIITNVPASWVRPGDSPLAFRLGAGRERRLPLMASYEALGRGRLGVLASSFGTLEVAVALGRGAARLRARVGQTVRFRKRGSAPNPRARH